MDPAMSRCLRSAMLALVCAAMLAACGTDREAAPVERVPASPGGDGRPDATPSSGAEARLVVLGDSLTAGLGVAPSESYPARLQSRLDEGGHPLRIVNAGVSGDTSAGGLRRLAWALDGGDGRVVGLVVALGGNDGLRGLDVAQLRSNLEEIVTTAHARGVEVLLAGMEAPPNYGPDYTAAFRDVYADLATRHDVVYVPFLLEGVAGVAELNQSDGIHPNAEGAARVAAHLWPAVETLVRRLDLEDAAPVPAAGDGSR